MVRPLVSVIIPIYNADRYLSRCIESVLKQDYQDIEIILVNDGSTDSSLSVCQDYSNRYPEKVRVLNKTNMGCVEYGSRQYCALSDEAY